MAGISRMQGFVDVFLVALAKGNNHGHYLVVEETNEEKTRISIVFVKKGEEEPKEEVAAVTVDTSSIEDPKTKTNVLATFFSTLTGNLFLGVEEALRINGGDRDTPTLNYTGGEHINRMLIVDMDTTRENKIMLRECGERLFERDRLQDFGVDDEGDLIALCYGLMTHILDYEERSGKKGQVMARAIDMLNSTYVDTDITLISNKE